MGKVKGAKTMTRKLKLCIGIPAAALILCSVFIYFYTNRGTSAHSDKLVVVSPHPMDFMIPLIREFENETGIAVELYSRGTAEAIESIRTNPDVDVLWGGSLLTVGPYIDSFYEYRYFSNVPSVIMINNDLIGDIRIEGYADLLNPELKGQIAYADPGKSSSSFEHLVNMLFAMGGGDPDAGWDYVEQLTKNLDGVLLNSSSAVYKGVANGEFKVGLTFEEAAVTMLKNDKHIGIVYMTEGVVSTPDGIYINKNSSKLDKAAAFADFMTSRNAQRFMAANLGRRSVRTDVEASGMVIPLSEIHSIFVDKDTVVSNKDAWLQRFDGLVKEAAHE